MLFTPDDLKLDQIPTDKEFKSMNHNESHQSISAWEPFDHTSYIKKVIGNVQTASPMQVADSGGSTVALNNK